jgi:hypothetical protein
MKSEYMTVLDAGTPHYPAVPLVVVLAMPVLLLAFAHVAKARRWRSATGPLKLFLWVAYLSYAPMVLYQYWTLWSGQASAQDATQISVAAGPVARPAIDQVPDGLFLETSQRFAVNGVDFQYRHQSLRYLDFLMPHTELVSLPLFDSAQVRITYRGEGDARQLLRFEIQDKAHD